MPTVAQLAANVKVEGVTQAEAQLATFSGALTKTTAGHANAARSAADHTRSMRALGTGALLAGGSLAAGLGLGARASADLETALAPIGTLLGANSKDAASLDDAMRGLIANSPQSADELGMAAYTILSAGISGTTNVMGTLRASQQLSAAGLGSVKEATDLVTSAMNSYKSEGLDANTASQMLFGTITQGKTTTAGLAQGFGNIAPLAAAAGVSFKDLLSATAAMTGTGQSASEAYTGLRGVITNVLKPSKDAADAAETLGINFSAAHLRNVGLPKFLDEIKTAADGNNDAIVPLFGSVEAMNQVLGLTGPQAKAFAANLNGIAEQGKNLAARSQEMGDTAANSFAKMKNSLMVATAEAFTPFVPVLTAIAEGIGGVARDFNTLPGPVKEAAVVLAMVTAGGLLTFGVLQKVTTGVQAAKAGFDLIKNSKVLEDFRAGLNGVATEGSSLSNKLGSLTNMSGGTGGALAGMGSRALGAGAIFATTAPLINHFTDNTILANGAAGAMAGMTFGPWGAAIGGALGAASGALGLFSDDAEEAKKKISGLAAEINKLSDQKALGKFLSTDILATADQGVDALTNRLKKLAEDSPAAAESVMNGFKKMGDASAGLASANMTGNEAYKALLPTYEKAIKASQDAAAATEHHAKRNQELIKPLDDSAKAEQAMADKTKALKDAEDAAKKSLDDFNTSLDSLVGKGPAVVDAQVGFAKSLDDLTAAAKENTGNWDINTEAGRKHISTVTDAIERSKTLTQAVLDQTGSYDAAKFALGGTTAKLWDQLQATGLTTQATRDLLVQMYGIPADQAANINSNAELVAWLMAGLHGQIDSIPATKEVTVDMKVKTTIDPANPFGLGTVTNPFGLPQRARGGFITSPEVSLIGEAGPELILPLNDQQRSMSLLAQSSLPMPVLAGGGGGNSYSIQVSVGVGAQPSEVGREIVDYIKKYERSSGAGWRN